MAIDPELAERAAYTKIRIRCLCVNGPSSDAVMLIVNDLLCDLVEITKEIKRSLRFVPEIYFNIPTNLFKEKLTYKLTRHILKIPSCIDRMVNKRKTYLKSLV